MFSKVLVANRGEIAVRAFRAAVELGAQTVAVFPWEDRNSLHRLKADQSFQIGETGHPVRAYLSVEEILAAARTAGAGAAYPGYGSLSETPGLAEGCARAGITFVGPPADILKLAGNKARAIAAARDAGLPVLASSEPSADPEVLVEAARAMEFPVFVKAVAGGGGRGMRRVATPAELPEALGAAMREAEAAFGDPTVYLEQAVIDARHIEVQVLADAAGNVIHLYERDCSVQRRHQKVVELAPAPNLDPDLRQRICADAVAFARAIGYVNAGTVEFLVDAAAHPGRAHGDRRGHRRRPGAGPAAHRGRRDAPRPGPGPGRDRGPRRGPAVPHHHRGPGQRLPARHRPHHRLPLTRRRRGAAGRQRRPRRRHRGALRLAAGQPHLPRP